jgi:oxalate---CoA ligase
MTANTSLALEPSLELELLRLWHKLLNRSDLTIDDDFFESGGDSLLATELLVEIERLTLATIPPSILFETGTVRQLAERLGRQESLTPQPAVRIGGEEGRLFHFFHGDFNYGGLSVPRLAAILGPDRPILALAPHGIDGERVPASIEEMAADRLPQILEAQPRGPYVLGGHCNGALVAFETARLLINAGHRVDLVVMIDPVVVSVRRSARLLLLALDLTNRAAGVASDLRRHSLELAWFRLAKIEIHLRRHLGRLTRLWNKSWTERCHAIGWRLGIARSADFKGTASSEIGAKSSVDETREDLKLRRAYSRAMSVYHPSPLAVPILYIALRFSGGGWRRMSPEIELIDVPGRHLMSGDSAAGIVGRVRARLDALDASTGVSTGG